MATATESNLDETLDDEEARTFERDCPRDYSATACRVVRGPAVQLNWRRSGGEILSTAEARAYANAILAAADVADRNG